AWHFNQLAATPLPGGSSGYRRGAPSCSLPTPGGGSPFQACRSHSITLECDAFTRPLGHCLAAKLHAHLHLPQRQCYPLAQVAVELAPRRSWHFPVPHLASARWRLPFPPLAGVAANRGS